MAVSTTGQTGQSEAIHSPEAWASMVVRLTIPTAGSMALVCAFELLLREWLRNSQPPRGFSRFSPDLSMIIRSGQNTER